MYEKQINSEFPGLIVIMIDQSGSMSDSYGGSTKAEFTALAVNRVISETIKACTEGERIKDRCYIAAIGYGGESQANPNRATVLFLEKLSELAKNDKFITLKKKVSDGAGGLVEVDDFLPIFVESSAYGGTPMAEAFNFACEGAEQFIQHNPDSFPPIVINITDGEPNNMEAVKTAAKKLTSLSTSDGNVLLINSHIADVSAGDIVFPTNNVGFANNSYANFLFEISSFLPDKLISFANKAGLQAEDGSKSFVFNAKPEDLVKVLDFGSRVALR